MDLGETWEKQEKPGRRCLMINEDFKNRLVDSNRSWQVNSSGIPRWSAVLQRASSSRKTHDWASES